MHTRSLRGWSVVLCLFLLAVAGRAWAAPPDGGSADATAAAHIAAHAHDAAVEAAADVQALDATADAEPDAEDAEAPDAAEEAAAPAESVSAAPSASAAPTPHAIVEGSPVRLHDKRVFAIRGSLGGLGAEERARRASAALERAFDESDTDDVRVDESKPGLAVVLVGNRPIVELTQEDAEAAGDASLSAHAAGVGENIRSALKAERTRRAVSKRVFSWSLVVLTALLAFLALRRTHDIAERARKWVGDNPKRLPALRIGSVEVLRPAAFQGLIRIAISLALRALQLTLLYLWLVFTLSLFESTRDVSAKVTGFVLTPLGALAGRIASALPLFVVGIIAIIVVGVVLRFVRLFFHSVEVGETHLVWVPADLAGPTGAVVRLGIVIGALVLGAPLVTGTDEGAAARAGMVVLASLGLALVPILASLATGFSTVFWRRMRVGDFISFDGRQGRIASLTLHEVRVHDGEGSELRIPHLLTLVKPLRVLGPYPLATFEVVVDPKAEQGKVRELLMQAGASKHGEPRVRLLSIDAEGALYEIVAKRALDEEHPATAITRALQEAGISLGRRN
ncbi:MAG TPA: mechanosensitive ion channel domain-containing protein [Polyangiaceae bacterium]|nr:mechanosensitive ion channel domain-containing protein [Polyangiaceae bacterium]